MSLFNKIPTMFKFIIESGIVFFIGYIFNDTLSDVARETVCIDNHFASQFLCFYFTNSAISFTLTFITIIGIAWIFKKKFID